MKMKSIPLCGILLGLFAPQSFCIALNALIVHDSSGGLGTTTSNLSSKLTTAGFTVTSSSGVPGSLAGYRQIWDIRYNNSDPITPGERAQFLTYLSSGGSLFVMGENTGFTTRNNSVLDLIAAAGGGVVILQTPADDQIVQAPFTQPNPVSAITYSASSGTSGPGTGSFISINAANSGSAIVWAPGHLTNALTGTLIAVFDVNFLDGNAAAPLQALTANLIAYLGTPTPVGALPILTPTLGEWGLIGLAAMLVLFGVFQIRLRGVALANRS